MDNFFKRVWSNFLDSFGSQRPPTRFGQRVQVGDTYVYLPDGWQVLKSSEDTFVASSSDNQQATVSVVRSRVEISFDEFKRLCEMRLSLERQELPGGLLDAKPPFADGSMFHQIFSGQDSQNGRSFLGYLSAARRELLTIYVEGRITDRRELSSSFSAFVKRLQRR